MPDPSSIKINVVLNVEKHMNFSKAFYAVNNNIENEELSAAAEHGVPQNTGRYTPNAGYVTPPPGNQRARSNIPTLEEELRHTASPFHEMIQRQHAELAALRARGVSPNTLKHFRRSHMEERRGMMNSPLPRAHSPEKEVGEPPAAAAAAVYGPPGLLFGYNENNNNNNNNNNYNAEEAAFGEPTELVQFANLGLGGGPIMLNPPPRLRMRKQRTRKQRRSKSRRNRRRYTRR